MIDDDCFLNANFPSKQIGYNKPKATQKIGTCSALTNTLQSDLKQ